MNGTKRYRQRFLTSLAAVLVLLRLQLAAGASEHAPPNVPAEVTPIESSTLHNLFALTTNVFSGSSPDSEEGFAVLANLGVKTIISVDGAKPDVDSARKHGMRYVHLPHGYDGIGTNLQLQLVRAAETLAGPIYVHCHHGKHRGPAAAAVICMANGWDSQQAEAWLVAAGTATNYVGLYEVVHQFQKPTAAQLRSISSDFPETAKVSGLVDAMVDIDKRWDYLKAVRAAAYQTPKEHPDIKPANEAIILWEHYREAQRLPDAVHHGADFIQRLATSEAQAKEAERLLRSFDAEKKHDTRLQLDRVFDAMGMSCASCHKTYRDTAKKTADR